jgi:hypothetical protein
MNLQNTSLRHSLHKDTESIQQTEQKMRQVRFSLITPCKIWRRVDGRVAPDVSSKNSPVFLLDCLTFEYNGTTIFETSGKQSKTLSVGQSVGQSVSQSVP